MVGLAAVFGLAALVEAADDAELERALSCGARLIGINQRDLVTFEVNRRRAEEMVAGLPPYVVAVAESGIQDAEDAQRLASAGYQAVLVGESLVRSADRVGAVKAMVGYPVGPRRLDAPARA
jgi:indole-3-glycerol phosphate synthase